MLAEIIRAWVVVIVLACCAVTSDAHAASELELAWSSPAECPGRTEVEQRIEAQLGRRLRDGPLTLHVAGEVVHDARGYTLQLRTERGSEHGERTLQAGSCSELVDAVVLVLALSIDDPAQAPSSSRSTSAAKSDESLHAAPRERFVSLRASGVIEHGAMPRLAGGAELALALTWGRSHAELTGLFLPRVAGATADDGARVDVQLWATRIGYCHDLLGQRVRLASCAALELGRMDGAGVGLVRHRTQAFAWSAGWLSLRLSLRLHARFSLVLEPALAVPFVRRQFVSSRPEGGRASMLHGVESTSRRASLGAELTF
jgi:hypothetical protein